MVRSKVQDMTEVKRWFEEGRTYDWMIQTYLDKYDIETTKSMWNSIRRRQGWEARVHRDPELIPWRVAEEHSQAYPLIMLRAEARRRAGRHVTPKMMESLTAWLEGLKRRDAVVLYDRELGFFYVPREDSDTDIIRKP